MLVNQGTAYFNVRHKRDDDFRVAFANREIQVDRNVHFRLDLSGGNPELAVFKGDLEVQRPARNDQGQEKRDADVRRCRLRPLRPGEEHRAAESYDAWDNDRINYASQYASSSYNSHSPYYYGASDLNYYGSWSS